MRSMFARLGSGGMEVRAAKRGCGVTSLLIFVLTLSPS
jgi:hypothetical protein